MSFERNLCSQVVSDLFAGSLISIFRFILFGALFPRAAGPSLSRILGIELRFLRFLPSGWFLRIGNSVRVVFKDVFLSFPTGFGLALFGRFCWWRQGRIDVVSCPFSTYVFASN